MATRITYTPHLKLRITSDLSADSIYNLNKIDSLATTYVVDTTDTLQVRSRGNITFQANSADIGGSGSGGTLSFGTDDHQLSQISFNGPVSFSGGFEVEDALTLAGDTYSTILSRNLSQTSDLTFTLPVNYGASGQFLVSDGLGGMSWSATPIGAGTVKQATYEWESTDGAEFLLVHGLGTTIFQYSVYELDTGSPIIVQSIVVVNENAIRLTASEPPDTSWGVTLRGEW